MKTISRSVIVLLNVQLQLIDLSLKGSNEHICVSCGYIQYSKSLPVTLSTTTTTDCKMNTSL